MSKKNRGPERPVQRTLRVVDEPDPKLATILDVSEFEGPLIRDPEGGIIEYVCGACRRPLLVGTSPGQVKDLFFKCSCGVYVDCNWP